MPGSIGIIGAGQLGSNLARGLAARGGDATIANCRGPASLAELVRELGPSVTAGTVAQAEACGIVIAALRWADSPGVLGALADCNDRILVDAMNAVEFLEPGDPAAIDPSNPLGAMGLCPADLCGERSTRAFGPLAAHEFVAGGRRRTAPADAPQQ